VRVAVQDPWHAVGGAVDLQPLREVADGQRFGRVPVVSIAFEQPKELRNLALQKGTRPLELG
jgi:hypothetical protein